MNTLERSTIEKAGYANGFENVRRSTEHEVALYSSRHKAEVRVAPCQSDTSESWLVGFNTYSLMPELRRTFPETPFADQRFSVAGEASLGRLLRRAAELAKSLPNQAAEDFAREIENLEPLGATESLAIVKQRRGQEIFRGALMDYWGGACAVTGIAIPELLRASHAKPWAKCASDAERLNVFNGLLLCAHLDALFDRGLMTFSQEGTAVFSGQMNPLELAKLNLAPSLALRWLAAEHEPFLAWHRGEVFASP